MAGLQAEQEYVLTFYTRGFGDVGPRLVNVTTSDDGIVTTLDQNVYGNGQGCLFEYTYAAPVSGQLILTFEAMNPADTWHHYAFSNELVTSVYLDPMPLPSSRISPYSQLSWELNGVVDNPIYHLKIATDSEMSNMIADISDLTEAGYDPDLISETDYYWQVEVSEEGRVIYTSPVWTFRTLSVPPNAVKLLEWKFDEMDGTIAHQSTVSVAGDGVLYGFNDPNRAWIYLEGIADNALDLNGMDEYVDVSSASGVMPVGQGQSFSISGYVRTFADYGPIFSMRNSSTETPIIDLALGADGVQNQPGKICLLVRDDAGALSYVHSGLTINDGRWHNVIISRDSDDWVLYVDGVICATMENIATGSLTLDWLAIGSSIEWIRSDWQPLYNHYRYFDGYVDEFTVWQGAIQPPQVNQLVSILPPAGDLDQNLKVDINDFSELAAEWDSDIFIPVQQINILEDMETYAQDSASYEIYWDASSEAGYGNTNLSLTSDTEGIYGQVLQWDYNFNGNDLVKSIFQLQDRRTDLTLFDQLQIRVKKLSGSAGDTLIADIYDGRGNLFPEIEGMHYKGRVQFDLSTLVENQWYTLQFSIPYGFNDGFPETCYDLYEIEYFIKDDTQQGDGAILIDRIELTDGTMDCVPVVGNFLSDINADCSVDMLDLMTIAESWLLEEM